MQVYINVFKVQLGITGIIHIIIIPRILLKVE